MSKLREDLSIVLLGAAAGLFSSTITVLIDRINVYYAYLSAIDRSDCFYHERDSESFGGYCHPSGTWCSQSWPLAWSIVI